MSAREMKLTNKQYSSMIEVDPEDLAAQLTLIDLAIFKKIGRDEFIGSALSRGLSKSKRHNCCPNVTAMKRQFNQISFWAVGQILAHNSTRQRAELVSQFIKTAKRLHQLNNLHSSFALISALLSSPIYRLERTWQNVNKKYPKDKLHFDRLRQLYSDTNNYESLRQHLSNCDLPCIPYLGVYSRDIIYLNEVYRAEDTPQRTKSTNKIIESIEKFQSSKYNDLFSTKAIHDYLMVSTRYIDELQKFIEDENHRRSLEIEPPNCINGLLNVPLAIDHKFPTKQLPLHHSSSASSIAVPSTDQHQHQHGYRLRANMLAGFSSMVHSAVVSTSTKLNNISPLMSGQSTKLSTSITPQQCNIQKCLRYLIDDSLVSDSTARTDKSRGSGGGGGGASRSASNSDDNLYLSNADYTNFPPPISTSS